MLNARSQVDREALAAQGADMLGFGGLLPFAGLVGIEAFGAGLDPNFKAEVERWVLLYAAIIVSFMGGARWGLRAVDPDGRSGAAFAGFLAAVMPALLGWIAVGLPEVVADVQVGPWPRFLVLALLLVLQLGLDWAHQRDGWPAYPGYLGLRVKLTSGAAGSIVLASILAGLTAS